MIPTNSSYIPDQAIFPFQGVDYVTPSTQIGQGFASEMLNTETLLGRLAKRRGYTTLGSVSGIVLALVEFKDITGTTHFVCITTTHEYKWSGSSWTKITFKDNSDVEQPRTGTEDDGIDYLVTTGTNSDGDIVTWLIITNGIDKPRYWDGTLATFYEFSTASVSDHGAALVYPDFVTCKTISALQGYIVLGNVTTTANEPVTIVWSDTVSLFDFETNNSGAVLLPDVVLSILKILPLGDSLIIYGDDTIHSMNHIGADQIFSFQKIIGNTRLLSGRAVVDVGPFHYFMAQENIYLFDGTRGLRRVADRITSRYRDIFLSDLKTRAFAFLDQPKNSLYFVVPTSSSSSTIFKAEFEIFDVENIRWNVQSFAVRITSMGFFSNSAGLTWNTINTSITWSSYGQIWNQGSINKGFPRRVMGSDGTTVLADDTSQSDASTAIVSSWESIDFTVPRDFLSSFARWTEIEFEARGGFVDVSISLDKGFSYQLLLTIILNGSWKRYRVFLDSTSQTIRLKFSDSSASNTFEINWYRVWFSHSGSDD